MKQFKRLILALTITACAVNVFAQGLIVFGNHITGSVLAPIYGPEPYDCCWQVQGNTANGFPAGTAIYTGPALSGSGFTVQLWGGPEANSLSPVAEATFGTGNGAGYFASRMATIDGVAAGSPATVQLRAWDNQGGTLTTWAQAVSAGTGLGLSLIFTTPPLGGGINVPPNLVGLTSFSIRYVPEPSVFALAGLGAALWFVFRRTHQNSTDQRT